MDYWNDIYWKNNLNKNKLENLDFLKDIWIDKYSDVINQIPKGKCLDLGCGIGQYTKYFKDIGFDVISCDISEEALKTLKSNIPEVHIEKLDMTKNFPFPDKSFDLIVANLSIHYFDYETTKKLLNEIKRVLKKGGYFVGSVNSDKTYKFLIEPKKIEDNYYKEMDRFVRLWNKEQFDDFFKKFNKIVLEEVTTTRWNKIKIMWEFIYKID